MAKTVITPEMVHQQIVKNLNKDNVMVTRKGKKLVPTCVDDLPPRLLRASIKGINMPQYTKAHAQLYYKLVTKKTKVKQVMTKKAPAPIPVEPMKEYREIARTGRVSETKKLVINISNYSITITNDGLITIN